MSALVNDSQNGNVIYLFDTVQAKLPTTDASTSGLTVSASPESENHSCDILQLANRFPFYASIEVNDLPWVRVQFSTRSRDGVLSSVKKILCQEFGRKRVNRCGHLFDIQHRNAEILIASLLRVQFYTNQILLPEYNIMGERMEQNGVSITWGVGRDPEQACQDRVKKRRSRLPGAF